MSELAVIRAAETPGDSHHCMHCQAPLTREDIGLTKKLLTRTAVRFLCLDCLAKHFGSDRETMQAYVDKFRKAGCVLF